MKLETKLVFSQGIAFVLIGFFSPWTAALAQWANSGEWPPLIAWIVILAVSVGGGATSWLAFCSGTWKDYARQMKADDTGVAQTVTAVPTAGVDTTAERARKAQVLSTLNSDE